MVYRASALVSLIALVGCAVMTPIQPASTSKSRFEGAAYKGETVKMGTAMPGNEAYRVFIQGATGFVSMQSVREDAEQRAKDFCGRKGREMESLNETTAKPPYILGNFPRIEIIFDCIEEKTTSGATGDDAKYQKLMELKKLLDGNVITQQEFDSEKAKILAEP